MGNDGNETTRGRGRMMAACRRGLSLCVVVAVLVGLCGTPALADTTPEAKKRAMAALVIAKQYYAEKEFKLAAKLFHKAYSLDPKPAFLYNAARAEQRGFMLVEAQRDYERLIGLKNVDAETRKRAKVKLEEVREARAHYKPAPKVEKPAPVKAEARAAEPAAKAKPVVEVEAVKEVAPKQVEVRVVNVAAPSQNRWLGWLSLGLGSASLAVGTTVALQGRSSGQTLSTELDSVASGSQPMLSEAQYDTKIAEKGEHESKMTTGLVLAGVGAAVAGVGAYLLLKSAEPPSVALGVGVGSDPRVTMSWRF